MNKQSKALRWADLLEYEATAHGPTDYKHKAAAELLRLHHNNEVLMNALWKACGDDKQTVNDTIESQGELK